MLDVRWVRNILTNFLLTSFFTAETPLGALLCIYSSEEPKTWVQGHFEIILHLEPCIIHLSIHPLYTTEVAKALCFAQRPQRRQSRKGMGTKIATQFYFPWVSLIFWYSKSSCILSHVSFIFYHLKKTPINILSTGASSQ